MHLQFRIEADAACGTLEAVLATARRGGLVLSRLDVVYAAPAVDVRMQLRACDDDVLQLFATRLAGLIGVFDIETIAMTLPPEHEERLAAA